MLRPTVERRDTVNTGNPFPCVLSLVKPVSRDAGRRERRASALVRRSVGGGDVVPVVWTAQKQDRLALLRAEVAQTDNAIAQAVAWIDRGMARPYRVRVSVVFVGRKRWQEERGYMQPSPAMQCFDRLKVKAEARMSSET